MEGINRDTVSHTVFMPRRSGRGGVAATTAAAFGTMALYNNANSQFALLVRAWAWQPSTTTGWGFGYVQSRLTGTPGVVTPFVSGIQPPFGLVDYSSQAAATPTDFSFGTTTSNQTIWWEGEIPFGFLLPGWSLFVQHAAIGQAVAGGFIWEMIDANEI